MGKGSSLVILVALATIIVWIVLHNEAVNIMSAIDRLEDLIQQNNYEHRQEGKHTGRKRTESPTQSQQGDHQLCGKTHDYPPSTLATFPAEPYKHCEHLPTTGAVYSQSYTKLRALYDHEFKRFASFKPRGSEQVAGQNDFYYRLSQEPWIETVCEVGFNTGITALQWLSGGSSTRQVHYFDIVAKWNGHVVTHMSNFYTKQFPNRFHLNAGDSLTTIPNATHLRGKCDLVVIDGGHTLDVANEDLINMKMLANPRRHLIIMDDVPAMRLMDEVVASWMFAQIELGVCHIFGCWVKAGEWRQIRGFSVGFYHNLTVSRPEVNLDPNAAYFGKKSQ